MEQQILIPQTGYFSFTETKTKTIKHGTCRIYLGNLLHNKYKEGHADFSFQCMP